MTFATPSGTNSAVLFLDLQEGIVKESKTVAPRELKRSAATLAKAAVILGVPAVFSAVGSGGAYAAEILQPFGNPEVHERSCTSAFGDPAFVRALEATGRTVLLLAGVVSEIVVLRTALDALARDYVVHVAVDGCGSPSPRNEEAAWRRIVAAGGTTSSITTYLAETAGDFNAEPGRRIMPLLMEHLGRT